MEIVLKRTYVTILLIYTFIGIIRANIGEKDLHFRDFSVNQGLSQYDVTSIVQDSIGYLWIGTYDGLNRFNGFENQVFRYTDKLSNSIPGNRVLCLCSGPKGNIWIGTEDGGLGVFNIYSDQFIPIIAHSANAPTSISALFFHNGLLIVGTTHGNIYFTDIKYKNDSVFLDFEQIVLDKKSFVSNNEYVSSINKIGNTLLIGYLDGELIQLKKNNDNYVYYNSIKGLNVTDILIDSQNQIWVGTFNGLKCYRYLEGYEEIIEITPTILTKDNSHRITSVSEDINKDIWYTTYLNGLFQLKKSEDHEYKLEQFSTKNSKIGVDNLSTTFIDKSNTLWLGSHNDGVRIIDLFQKEFYKVSFYNRFLYETSQLDQHHLMSSCLVDSHGNLWAGIQEKGLFLYTKDSNIYYFSNKDAAHHLNSNTVTKLIEVSNRNLWFTSWQGLYTLHRSRNINKNYSFEQIDTHIAFSNIINTRSFFSICEDVDGNLWLGGIDGLFKLIFTKSGKCIDCINYSSVVRKNNIGYWVMSLAANKEQRIILAGTKGGGLFQINYKRNSNDIDVEQFSTEKKGNNSISNNNVWTILVLNKEAWIGTDNGVNIISRNEDLYNFKRHIGIKDGLPSNKIVSIEIDFNGNIWLGTGQGLSKYNLENNKISNYDYHDGLQSNSFNETSFFDKKGRLYFGGINGLNYFDPNQIIDNYPITNIQITAFYIRNQKLTPGLEINKKVIINKSIPFIESLTLDFFSNDFSIDFQSFNYSTATNNIYEYKLEGYDKDWLNVKGNIRSARYSNLPYGNYTFVVRLANTDEHKKSSTRSLAISISRPFWLTWWAYSLYLLTGISILLLVIRFFIERNRDKNEILIEKHKREQIQELNEMKIRFFINISHELRTPLTLILEPLQLLKEYAHNNLKIKKYIELAALNAQKLHQLITQLLEFRQAETGNKRFNPEKGDLIQFIQSICDSFTSLTDKKSMSFSFESDTDSLIVYFDKDIIDKILSNLISNALKFTQINGKITVAIHQINSKNEKEITLTVTDNGIGIPAEQQEKIFERFYQVKGNSGFGIGLAFSNNLALIHKGKLSVESKPGEGSSFCLTIPFIESTDHEIENDKASDNKEIETNWLPIDIVEYNNQLTKKIATDEDQIVLLAEDNNDLREFVYSYLSESYTVLTANNGEEAFNIAMREIPDIIITDIMMPITDGIELAKKLSNDINTNHIPIIFLTAKDDHADQLLGLDTGAVDYIIKPFNVLYLHKKIENILHTLKLQQDKARSAFLQLPKTDYKKPQQNQFLNKAYEIVMVNISNSDFNVKRFSSELGVSRMQLHRKLKGTIGQSTTEFIRCVRIKHAAELLSQGQHNVSEAMYEAGFDNPSYFNKVFKKICGVNPSEFAGQYTKAGQSDHTWPE